MWMVRSGCLRPMGACAIAAGWTRSSAAEAWKPSRPRSTGSAMPTAAAAAGAGPCAPPPTRSHPPPARSLPNTAAPTEPPAQELLAQPGACRPPDGVVPVEGGAEGEVLRPLESPRHEDGAARRLFDDAVIE